MHQKASGQIRLNRLSYAVSLALASLMAGHVALAQETPAAPPAATPTATQPGEITTVVVSTRRSQQSAIDRKKNAATAMDSIVAEDVGSLPDRNVGEAISRIAGIAIDRGDYGEGISVSVRGNGPDLTRVELDGQAVQSAGGTDMNGGGDGRGTEFRQLSADLIKSVDVVKGSTADMTEGSLGGSIQIKTRTSLDFDKPFVSIRAAATNTSLNNKWDPDSNLIVTKKFLDGRLGVMANLSAQTLTNESHQFQTASSGNTGYMRMVDFDNSPEKTFTYQPQTLNMDDPASTTPVNVLSGSNGYKYTAATPQEILTKSAAAQTKADCYKAFPTLSTSSPELSPLSSSNRTTAVNLRSNEQLSCLHQWDDYIPALVRYFVKRQIDMRKNLDLRTDFKVNRDLTIYAKGSYNKRHVDDNYLTYSLGNVALNDSGYIDTNNVRAAIPGSGRYLFPNATSYFSGRPLVTGAVMNVIPSSVAVDSTHHVTQFTVDGAGVGVDQIHNVMGTDTRYLQFGGTYRHDALSAEFFVGDSKSNYWRGDKRTSWGYTIGPSTLTMAPSGIWAYTVPAGVNLNDWGKASVLLAPTSNTAPALTRTVATNFDPREAETGERTAKLDLAYALPESVPFFKRIKSGFNFRDTRIDSWGAGGYTVQAATGTPGTDGYVPAITVPGNSIRGTIVGCADTAGSLGAGGTPCKYGYNPSSATSRAGQIVMTQQQFADIISGAMYAPATQTRLFNGASGRPAELIDNWTQIDVEKVFAMAGVPNINYDCIKECVGSDGKVYAQPVSRVRERSEAFYVMSDFSLDHIPFTSRALPFGWELEGNLGYRYIRTKVHGSGLATIQTYVKTAQFNPLDPNNAAGVLLYQATRNVELDSTRNDFLPIYNLAMWVVPDKVVVRYNHAKTVAQPPASRLLAAGTCTIDPRRDDTLGEGADMTCGTFGNPALKGQQNTNQNLSVEWYPNKDTMLTASAYKQQGKVGPAITKGVNGVSVFAGTDLLAPGSGVPLSEETFSYNQWVNGPAAVRTGVEFSGKTAFTFLPWKLRYTGLDANLTRQHSNLSRLVFDFLNGETLSPRGEPRWSYNWALWYDDGKFSARVAVQGVGAKYSCTVPCGATLNGVNYNLGIYPNTSDLATRSPQYNPGSPQYTDMTRYVDGKIAYRISKSLDIFIEGRNLTNQTATQSLPSLGYASGPNYASYYYPGRRITVGLNWRNL